MIKLIGKARAMEYILTGLRFNAEQAKNWGLVSNVYPVDKILIVNEAVKLATEIASVYSNSLRKAKQCINTANSFPITNSLKYERGVFHSLFDAVDKSEGLIVFIEKRKSSFTKL